MEIANRVMQLEEIRISGLYLRGYLAGLRKITGNQYAKVMTKAGLREYLNKYPPSVDAPVATARHLLNLHEAIAEYISPELHDMFLRNLGRSFAQNAVNTPGLREAILKLGPVSTDAQVFGRALHIMAKIMDKTVMDGDVLMQTAPDGKGWLLTYTNCLNCVNQSRCNEKGGCTAIPAFYKELIQSLTGVRVQVDEVECGVAAERTCRYLITASKFL